MLNQHFPERVIIKTNRDPAYISPNTPHTKDMLRCRNRLMRAGRVQEAGALSVHIGQATQNCCRAQTSRYIADDKNLVVPSANVGTRTLEIDNIATAANNLRLNVAKTREIVFRNPRWKTAATPPPSLPGISRENSLKILGVTITSHLSASDHIRQVISGRKKLHTVYPMWYKTTLKNSKIKCYKL